MYVLCLNTYECVRVSRYPCAEGVEVRTHAAEENDPSNTTEIDREKKEEN